MLHSVQDDPHTFSGLETPVARSNRTVYRRPDGAWANLLNGAERASSLHDTQGDAVEAAHEMLENQGGGELTIIGRDGLIRSKDTVASPDPFPPRDTEH